MVSSHECFLKNYHGYSLLPSHDLTPLAQIVPFWTAELHWQNLAFASCSQCWDIRALFGAVIKHHWLGALLWRINKKLILKTGLSYLILWCLRYCKGVFFHTRRGRWMPRAQQVFQQHNCCMLAAVRFVVNSLVCALSRELQQLSEW